MIKEKSIEFEGNTVKDIINQFIKTYGDKLDSGLLSQNKKKLNEQILILLNGKNIRYLDKYRTKLNDGDNIYLSIPLAGG